MAERIARKMGSRQFCCAIRIGHDGKEPEASSIIREVAATLSVYDDPEGNRFTLGPVRAFGSLQPKREFLLNAVELAALVHVPSGIAVDNLVKSGARSLPPPIDLPIAATVHDIVIGITNHRHSKQPVVLTEGDRRRHVYILGKTGMGKTTLLETMITADLTA